MLSLSHKALLASLLLLTAATSNAFQPTSALNTIQRTRTTHQRTTTLHLSDDDEEQYEDGEEFFVSQQQILFLRKEASKRESNKKLPKWILPPEEATEVTDETVERIIGLFDKSELIEVRGISRDVKKHVYDTAHGLAGLLEEEMGKPVVVVGIKGFAAKMYSPWEDDRGDNIQLRTSYRPGQWTRKPKPIRDNRGQIIKGEDGKSIKKIPE
jgi:hypothetical protein